MALHCYVVFDSFRFELSGKTAYGYCAVVALLSFLLVRRLADSPFGLALLGLRENAARMPALGVPVRRRLVAAYTWAAALAGVAGALSAQTTGFVGRHRVVVAVDRAAMEAE